MHKWCPSLTIRGQQIRVNDTHRLLGIILDQSLSFNAHSKHIKQSLLSRIQAIALAALASWGWQNSLLRNAFSVGPLQARLRQTSIAILALQHQHHKLGLSPKSGCTFDNWVTSLYEALRLEFDVQSYYTESKCMIVQAREKCLRTASDHLKQLALKNDILQRIVSQCNFHHKATELSSIPPEELSHRQVINLFPSPPWLVSSFCTKQVSSTITGISGLDDPPVLKLKKNLGHTSLYQVDYIIYTDGSASVDTRNGGAASIISTGSPTQPTVVGTIKIKGRAITSSYEEEIASMEAALQ